MVQSQTQPISVEKISKDVVGRVVEITELAGDGTPTKWTFEADEFRQVQILEESVSGAAATIVIAMTTRNNPGPEDDAVQVSGKLRLHYELRQGEWILKDIENLAFQYTVGLEARTGECPLSRYVSAGVQV
jgi:hypothetical protein